MTSNLHFATSFRLVLHRRVAAWVAVVSLAALLWPAGSVAAQSVPLGLERWAVEVWPEYDRPAVLVLLNGTVQAGTALPVDVRIPVPQDAEINAVAFTGEDGRLISIPFSSEPTVGGQDIVFTLEQPDFVVEYYADVISPPPSRSFDLDFAAPYPAQEASVTLRQPARASDLTTTPAMPATGVDALGNPLYALQLGPLAAGQPAPLSVRYTKTDANPTVANAVVGDDVVAPPTASSAGIDSLPLVAGLVLALIVVAGVVFVMWRRNQRSGGSRQARRRAAREKGETPARASSAGASQKLAQNNFCPQCGAKYQTSDKFCRGCGAPRR